MKTLTKIRVIVGVLAAATAAIKIRERMLAKKPTNETTSVIEVAGRKITVSQVDHYEGVDYTAYAVLGENKIYFPRKLWNSPFKDAILQHEIGHIVLGHVVFQGDQLGLIQVEMEADKYAVNQGHINALMLYRALLLPLTILDIGNYNNINLGYLISMKIRSY